MRLAALALGTTLAALSSSTALADGFLFSFNFGGGCAAPAPVVVAPVVTQPIACAPIVKCAPVVVAPACGTVVTSCNTGCGQVAACGAPVVCATPVVKTCVPVQQQVIVRERGWRRHGHAGHAHIHQNGAHLNHAHATSWGRW